MEEPKERHGKVYYGTLIEVIEKELKATIETRRGDSLTFSIDRNYIEQLLKSLGDYCQWIVVNNEIWYWKEIEEEEE